MGIEKQRRYCPEDDRMVLAEKPSTNHLLHLILTIFTAGLWLIPWVLVSMNAASNPYRCPHCGEVTDRKPPRGWRPPTQRDEDY